jgi:hypothetical protein
MTFSAWYMGHDMPFILRKLKTKKIRCHRTEFEHLRDRALGICPPLIVRLYDAEDVYCDRPD